jgi:NAD(P)-dependent dehydrogenase (short-subunit alcohol dehydrogenase family)
MIIENSIAIVTGANRGIGKALVEALAEAGAKKIYATARDVTSLSFESVRTEIVPVQLDVCDLASIDNLVREAGDASALFNNAGVLDFGDILDSPLENLQRNLETNFFGTLAMAKAFAPIIEENGGGAIINTLTLLSLASMPGLAAYNASKAAAWSMTLSLRASLEQRKIAVHSVFPGAVDTAMLEGVEMPKASPIDVAAEIVKGVNANEEDIFPDAMSTEVYRTWRNDHKAVEKSFAQM